MKTRFIFILPILLLLSGCAARVKTVTALPAGVSQTEVQNWDSAVAALQKIAVSTSTLRQAVISLNKSGIFPDSSAYVGTLMGIGRVDELQIETAKILQSVPSDWSLSTQNKVLSEMQQIQAILTNLTNTGIVGIKDSASQSQVTTLINNLAATVSLVISLTT